MKRLAALSLLLFFAPACDEPPSDPRLTVVAYVDNEPVYLSELQQYFKSNLVADDTNDDLPPGTMDEIKSRLFDALIEERMLFGEAQRREIQVSDLEIETYLDLGAGESPDDTDDRAWRQLEARQRLMVQKLQEQVVRAQRAPTDDEVAAYTEQHREQLLPSQPLELRALQLRSMKEAERVHREIRRKRMTFNEAALAYEPSPGQAVPQRMSWDSLSDELREALEKLKPGQVSRPIELHGSIYLFQVGKWMADPADEDAELIRQARLELESLRRREALDHLLDELRERSNLRIKSGSLSFSYAPI
jgi:hypothetical protein